MFTRTAFYVWFWFLIYVGYVICVLALFSQDEPSGTPDQEDNVWSNYIMPADSPSETIPPPSEGAQAAVYTRDHPQSKSHADNLSRVLLFGGFHHDSSPRGTWIYTPSDSSWFHTQTGKQPPQRRYHSLTSFCRNYIVLFGGIPVTTKANNTNQLHFNPSLGDTWLFNGVDETWEEVSPTKWDNVTHYPTPRQTHSAVALNISVSSCTCSQSVMMYGGYEDVGRSYRRFNQELWEFRCVGQKSVGVSFRWFQHRRQPGETWPPAFQFHWAVATDETKMAMLVSGIRLCKSSFCYDADDFDPLHQISWLFNMTTRKWSRFYIKRPKTKICNEALRAYSYVLFNHKRGSPMLIRDVHVLLMENRHWVCKNVTTDSLATSQVLLFDPVYVDFSVLVFGQTRYLGRDFLTTRILELRDMGAVWDLRLVDLPVGYDNPPGNTSGVWNRIGNEIVFSSSYEENSFFGHRGLYYPVNETLSKNIFYVHLPMWQFNMLFDFSRVWFHILAGGSTPDVPNLVWQLDLRSMAWRRYKTILPSFSMQKTAISANWKDELLVVYGGLTKLDDLSNVEKSVNFYTSDVWVYYLTRRQWFKVSTSGTPPSGRIYASLVYSGNNSFILFAGATGELPMDLLKRYHNPADVVISIRNEVVPRNFELRRDLWYLQLSECGDSCSESGITGHWTEVKNVESLPQKIPGRMGHTAVLVDKRMFIFGGIKVLRYGSADCYDDIWSYELERKTWRPISAHSYGQGKLSSSSSLSYSYRLCGNPSTVVNSRIVTSFPVSGESENVVSYISGRETWENHNISPPVVPDRFFTWQDQLIVVTQYQRNKVEVDESLSNLLLFPDLTKIHMSTTKLECRKGHFTANWSTDVCHPCSIGYFSSTSGATSCTKCPTGLTTKITGADSLQKCTCDIRHCSNGACLVVNREGSREAACKCNFGFTGERCTFPTLLIGTLTSIAAVITSALIAAFVQKIIKYRKQKRANDGQLEEMNRVWSIDSSEVQLMERLDQETPGSYGDVYQARYRDIDVAVKKLKLVMRSNAQIEKEFEREIQVMKSIRHPNIVLFFGAGKFCSEENCPFLVVEIMKGGALSSFIRNRQVKLNMAQQISFCLDIARGMQFLHNLTPPRVHRDVKSSNMLLSEKMVVKVSDFGSARLVKGRGMMQNVIRNPARTTAPNRAPLLNPNVDLSRNVGAVLWRAPEVFRGASYGTPIDVYSFGIVMWEIATQSVPYQEKEYEWIQDVADDVCSGVRPMVPPRVHEGYKMLMTSCWCGVPARRPNFSEIFECLQGLQETLDTWEQVNQDESSL